MPPLDIIPRPTCVFGEVSIRYAGTTKRLYLESPIVDKRTSSCITIEDVYDQLQGGPPIYQVDNSTYYITEDLYILDGITLVIKDKDIRLKSDSESFLNLRGHGGSILIEDSTITSWDPATEGPDENVEDGRSYISCVSEMLVSDLTCIGSAKNEMGECRLDVVRSEVSYLGYSASESWGLSYKVRGFCADKSNPEIVDMVGVYGDIVESEVHHMWHAHYSFIHKSGNISKNTLHDNIGYGVDLHDYSTGSLVDGNTVYNNGFHGIIGSKWCTDVHITNNRVYNSKVGIFSHRSGDRVLVENNEVYDNRDSGIVFLESSDSIIRNNHVYNNEVGVRMSVGSRNLTVENNIFENNGKYELWTYEGTDDVVDLDTKTPKNLLFHDNMFEGIGMKFDESENIQFVGNMFELSDGIEIEDTQQMLFSGNTPDNIILDVSGDSCFNPLSDIGDILCGDSTEVYTLPHTWFEEEEVTPILHTVAPTPSVTLAPAPSVTLAPTSSVTMAPTSSVTLAPSPVESTRGISTDAPIIEEDVNDPTDDLDSGIMDGGKFSRNEKWLIVLGVLTGICLLLIVTCLITKRLVTG